MQSEEKGGDGYGKTDNSQRRLPRGLFKGQERWSPDPHAPQTELGKGTIRAEGSIGVAGSKERDDLLVRVVCCRGGRCEASGRRVHHSGVGELVARGTASQQR